MLATSFIMSKATKQILKNGSSSLWRCGPSIDEDGYYEEGSTLSQQVLVDGMNPNQSCSLTIASPSSGVSAATKYELCLMDFNNEPYKQTISAYTNPCRLPSFRE